MSRGMRSHSGGEEYEQRADSGLSLSPGLEGIACSTFCCRLFAIPGASIPVQRKLPHLVPLSFIQHYFLVRVLRSAKP